jgi:LPS-assembly lipoprotein
MWWSDRRLRFAAVSAAALALAGCGFHLRGVGGSAALPPSLATVRVVMGGGANEPLAVAVREAISQAGAQVVDAGSVPTVVIVSEQVDNQVASVRTSTGKASEYLLRYTVNFRLDGPQSLPEQTIRLQRDYSFDPDRVLAKEQEERELMRSMRREAAQQIVRRLARSTGSSAP